MGLNAILNEMVRQAMEKNKFLQRTTARDLGISRSTLMDRMETYRIPKSWPPKRKPMIERAYRRGMTLSLIEKATIRQALESNGFDTNATRRALGIDRGALLSKMAKYKIAQPQVVNTEEKTPNNVHLPLPRMSRPPIMITACA